MHDEPDTESSQPRPRRTRKRSAADKVRAKQFPAAMRGYDREAVDAWQEEIAELVSRLEEQQPRDVAVRQALDDVGRETSSILRQAHQSADEIESRSRSQADARLERADREAEDTVREAEERADRLEEDARTVWDQRSRLIEEMRQLADEVLGVADDALERVEPPSGRQPEPVALDDGSDLLDTVEDDGTLEAPGDTDDADDDQEMDAGDQTRILQSPGDTQAFDSQDVDDDGDTTADHQVPGPQSPERL